MQRHILCHVYCLFGRSCFCNLEWACTLILKWIILFWQSKKNQSDKIIADICCIFRPAFGCCALPTLGKMTIFSVFTHFFFKKARNLQQILVKSRFFFSFLLKFAEGFWVGYIRPNPDDRINNQTEVWYNTTVNIYRVVSYQFLTVIQLNLPCTLFVTASRLTLC